MAGFVLFLQPVLYSVLRVFRRSVGFVAELWLRIPQFGDKTHRPA